MNTLPAVELGPRFGLDLVEQILYHCKRKQKVKHFTVHLVYNKCIKLKLRKLGEIMRVIRIQILLNPGFNSCMVWRKLSTFVEVSSRRLLLFVCFICRQA